MLPYSHFSSIFCRCCQIPCFLHTVEAVDLTTPAQKKENENNRSEFSDQKIDIIGLKSCLKLAFQINYKKPEFL